MTLEAISNLFLSPHLDDVVLSCGATIHRCATHGKQSLVISIFAGSAANEDHTPFARELRERWGGADDPVSVRREEDLGAVHAIGAHPVHLPLRDCVYRTGPESRAVLYPAVEDIFGEVHPEESSLHLTVLQLLLPILQAHPEATVYAPLAVGHHVDHVITLRAALLLRGDGRQVCCYEDYPYAVRAEDVARAIAVAAPDSGRWARSVEVCSEEDVRAKADGVQAYRSQISTFWPDALTMRRDISAYALAVGGGQYGEAFWRLPQP